jgi:hypothetical protein
MDLLMDRVVWNKPDWLIDTIWHRTVSNCTPAQEYLYRPCHPCPQWLCWELLVSIDYGLSTRMNHSKAMPRNDADLNWSRWFRKTPLRVLRSSLYSTSPNTNDYFWTLLCTARNTAIAIKCKNMLCITALRVRRRLFHAQWQTKSVFVVLKSSKSLGPTKKTKIIASNYITKRI